MKVGKQMVGRHILAALVVGPFVISLAMAEEIVVAQKDKAFSAKDVTINVGDTIVFTNEDSVTHNVYSRSKGFKFDSGAQRPGMSSPQAFTEAGTAKVRCAVHPRMKLTVHVK